MQVMFVISGHMPATLWTSMVTTSFPARLSKWAMSPPLRYRVLLQVLRLRRPAQMRGRWMR
eukprot:1539762-Alexandrium_andersonii.AAC.1